MQVQDVLKAAPLQPHKPTPAFQYLHEQTLSKVNREIEYLKSTLPPPSDRRSVISKASSKSSVARPKSAQSHAQAVAYANRFGRGSRPSTATKTRKIVQSSSSSHNVNNSRWRSTRDTSRTDREAWAGTLSKSRSEQPLSTEGMLAEAEKLQRQKADRVERDRRPSRQSSHSNYSNDSTSRSWKPQPRSGSCGGKKRGSSRRKPSCGARGSRSKNNNCSNGASSTAERTARRRQMREEDEQGVVRMRKDGEDALALA